MIPRATLWIALAAVAATAAPIRVGILKGTGTGRYWHTHMHPGAAAIAAMLANPAAAGIGNPVVPPQGFVVRMFGPDSAQCSGSGCGPTPAQMGEFVAALDTLDVALIMSMVEVGNRFSAEAHRTRFIAHWQAKGTIALHQAVDGGGTWPQWDSLNAVRFQNHPSTERQATLRLDTVGGVNLDPDWKFLNLGLQDTARFSEEWLSFTQNASVIRSISFRGSGPVRATVNIDENSYEGGLGGARSMGADHPMSWFRKFPGGGRHFYTALAHRASTFDSVYFFRRQLYNAILWASGYDVTTAVGDAAPVRAFVDVARTGMSGSSLTVSVLRDGPHAVEIRALDGRKVDARRGAGKVDHRFEALARGAAYIVVIRTSGERFTARVGLP